MEEGEGGRGREENKVLHVLILYSVHVYEREMASRVSLLVLHGCEAPLSGQQVADIASGGPRQKSTEHPLTHLECRLTGMEWEFSHHGQVHTHMQCAVHVLVDHDTDR